MAKKKKSKAERKAAAERFNQQVGARTETRAVSLNELDQHETHAAKAAAFLTNADDCCQERAQKKIWLKTACYR